MKVCAITCGYNEFFSLPIWLSHYGRELGPENCIVIDRGSDRLPDLSKNSLVRIPAAPLDEPKRVQTVTGVVQAMLQNYDVVIYSDCDELLVADPASYSGLLDFFAKTDAHAYTAIGVDIYHKINEEDPYDPERPILGQRSFCVFNSYLCKTLACREALRWGGGFHAASSPPEFHGLYVFHTAMMDCGERLKRAAQLRKFEVVDPTVAPYHRFPHVFSWNIFGGISNFPVRDFDAEIPELTARTAASAELREDGLYHFAEEVRPDYLLRIPERFSGRV